MFLNNHLIFDLEKALTLKLQMENRNVSEANRCRLSVMTDKLFHGSLSVIFLHKITNKNVSLHYCCPLTDGQLAVLEQSEHTPVMRSGRYLKTGHDTFMGIHYAYSTIQFPLDNNTAMDFYMAFDYLQDELEKYLSSLEHNDTQPI